jgi:hypothetical protein
MLQTSIILAAQLMIKVFLKTGALLQGDPGVSLLKKVSSCGF